MRRNIAIVFLVLIASASLARSQHHVPPYKGALLYSQPWIQTVPPVYQGQAPDVTSAYLLFDVALRLSSHNAPLGFFERMTYSDTARYLADFIYRVCDDNPLLYSQWLAEEVKPEPYRTDPGVALYELRDRIAKIYPDTLRTWMLVSSDMILHVHVTDTVIKRDAIDIRYKPREMVRVTAQIVDAIKGKYVPSCPTATIATKGNSAILPAITTALPTQAVLALPGTCIQFEYGLSWGRGPSDDDVPTDKILFDSIDGSWIKPGKDYIVFLKFYGMGSDSASHFITVWPVAGFGTNAGMYPIGLATSGISTVTDSSDDFGMGANLPVEKWKASLRARIHTLINP